MTTASHLSYLNLVSKKFPFLVLSREQGKTGFTCYGKITPSHIHC